MVTIISQKELRNDSGAIMRGLAEGKSYVVTRHSEPVGELTPLRRKRLVPAQAVIEILQRAPAVDRERFFADLDDTIDQSSEPCTSDRSGSSELT